MDIITEKNLEDIIKSPVNNDGEILINFGTLEEDNKPTDVEPDTSNTEKPNPNEGADDTNKGTDAPEGNGTPKQNTGLNVSTIINSNIGNGHWEDFKIIKDDGTEELLSEITDLDEETYRFILEQQQQFKEEKLKEEYIKLEGISETKRKVIEIAMTGGRGVAEAILQDPNLMNEPYEGMDPNEVKDRFNIFVDDLVGKGVPTEDAVELAQKREKDGTLYSSVTDIVATARESHKQHLEKVKQELLDEKAKEEQFIKNYEKELRASFTERKLDPKTINNLVKLATELEGDTIKIDSLYDSMIRDPKKAPLLIEFLNDPEAYNKRIKTGLQNEVNVQTMRAVKLETSKTATPRGSRTETEELPEGAIKF